MFIVSVPRLSDRKILAQCMHLFILVFIYVHVVTTSDLLGAVTNYAAIVLCTGCQGHH